MTVGGLARRGPPSPFSALARLQKLFGNCATSLQSRNVFRSAWPCSLSAPVAVSSGAEEAASQVAGQRGGARLEGPPAQGGLCAPFPLLRLGGRAKPQSTKPTSFRARRRSACSGWFQSRRPRRHVLPGEPAKRLAALQLLSADLSASQQWVVGVQQVPCVG